MDQWRWRHLILKSISCNKQIRSIFRSSISSNRFHVTDKLDPSFDRCSNNYLQQTRVVIADNAMNQVHTPYTMVKRARHDVI
jgi:hypothetical protein